MARLSNIRIAGWKSIRDIEPELGLRSLNVLIGANGSGKSNLVSFFKLLSELEAEHLQTYIGQLGGADSVLHLGSKVTRQIAADLQFDTDVGRVQYILGLVHAAPEALWIADERLVLPDDKPKTIPIGVGGHRESLLRQWSAQGDPVSRVIGDLLKRVRVFHFHDTSQSARIRLGNYIEANQGLYSDGGNLASMLYLYRQTKPMVYRRIVAAVRHIMPVFDDFVLEPQRLNPRNIVLNWKQQGSEYIFGPHQLSDGSLRAMALIALFLQPSEDLPAVIVVDEPELGLHPHAIEIITGLIRAASLETQIVLTTQSTTFLDHFEPEEVIVVDTQDGSSQFRRLDTRELEDWLKDYSVGELWVKNVVGGGPLA